MLGLWECDGDVIQLRGSGGDVGSLKITDGSVVCEGKSE